MGAALESVGRFPNTWVRLYPAGGQASACGSEDGRQGSSWGSFGGAVLPIVPPELPRPFSCISSKSASVVLANAQVGARSDRPASLRECSPIAPPAAFLTII